MAIIRLVVWIAVAALAVGLGFAEDPAAPQMPEPTPEHQKLDVWVGEWTGSGELKPGPFGPGGPVSWTEKCAWFGEAGFHVVCKSEGTGPMGPMKGLGIMGYDPAKEAYVHFGVDTHGWMAQSKGTLSDKTWTFHSKETMEGKTFHTRAVMEWVSATKMKFRWEMSEDGETWTILMDGTTEKK
jgi:hypothetical protein